MAEYTEIRTTFLRYAVSCITASKQTVYFLLVAFAVMLVNAVISVRLKRISAAIFNATVLLDNNQDQLMGLFFRLVLMICIHYSLSSLLDYTKDRIGYRVFRKSIADSSRETVAMGANDFHHTGTGKAQENITRSSHSLWGSTLALFVDIPQCIIFFCSYTHALLGLLRPSVAFFYFLGIFLCVVTVFTLTMVSKRYEAHFYRIYLQTHVYLTDILLNFDIIKTFNREEKEVETYDKSFAQFDKNIKSYHCMQGLFTCLQKLLMMFPHFVILYLFFTGYDTGLSVLDLIFYNSVFMSYRGNFITLRSHVFTVAKMSADMGPRLTRKVKNETGSTTIADFKDAITVEAADLYAGDSLINTNLNFVIRKGEKVAITGHNGSGKSTFLKTLCRLHDGRGGIKIDGISIDMLTDASVRNLIGYVPQDQHIFNNTVMYNLCYAQAKYNEQEVYRICQEYGLHEFFKNLPNGYFTMAGENGKYLSGGQKQRVNFMRAIIKGSPILVLDEPTANLDKATEAEIINSILTCGQDHTVLVIIHNLELLERFEKILYFTNNGVDVYGSYAEFQKNK